MSIFINSVSCQVQEDGIAWLTLSNTEPGDTEHQVEGRFVMSTTTLLMIAQCIEATNKESLRQRKTIS